MRGFPAGRAIRYIFARHNGLTKDAAPIPKPSIQTKTIVILSNKSFLNYTYRHIYVLYVNLIFTYPISIPLFALAIHLYCHL